MSKLSDFYHSLGFIWDKNSTYQEPTAETAAESKPQDPVPPTYQPKVTIPSRYENYYLKYSYTNIYFEPSPDAGTITDAMVRSGNYEIELRMNGAAPDLYYNGDLLGKAFSRGDMVRDWMARGEPVRAWLKEFGSSNQIAIAFYRDELAANAGRETSIVKLAKYSSQDAQDYLAFVREGDMLDCEEENDAVNVHDIGYLPRSVAKRYLEEGASLVLLDHTEYDVKKDVDIPFVKIFW